MFSSFMFISTYWEMKISTGAVPLYHGPFSRKFSHPLDMQGVICRGRLYIHFFLYRVCHDDGLTTTRSSYFDTAIGVIVVIWWNVYILGQAPSCLLWVQIVCFFHVATQVARFTWPTWSQPGSYRPHVGPINFAIWVSSILQCIRVSKRDPAVSTQDNYRCVKYLKG